MAVKVQKEWLLVRSQPNRETWAVLNIRRQRHECYLPRFYNRDRLRREPLFASYLFVQVINRSYAFLRSTLGVADVVMGTAGEAAFVRPDVIRELKQRENKNGLVVLPKDMPIEEGDDIVVRPGHLFGGKTGIYEGMVQHDRARILLAHCFPVTIDRRMIELVA